MLRGVGKTTRLVLMALFVALIIAGAYIKIPIPILPFTLQTMFTTMAGIMLGPVYGSAAVAVYIIMGLIGIPVFTQGGGLSYVLVPSFGFMIGMLIGALCGGLIVDRVLYRGNRVYSAGQKITVYIVACAVNTLIIYIVGIVYYCLVSAFYLGNSLTAKTVFINLFLLTLPGDIVKCALSVLLAYKLNPILTRSRYVLRDEDTHYIQPPGIDQDAKSCEPEDEQHDIDDDSVL